MRDTDLFQQALALVPPWLVTASRFDPTARRLDIDVAFPKGTRFACPICGSADCPVHDTEAKTWRHLDFFQHQAFLHARVPRVRCAACGVRQVVVPWAREGSGFTLLFEALAMTLMIAMPVAAAARLAREHDTRLWRILHHYVEQARARADHSRVTKIAFDETAAKRGHDYVSLFVDLATRRVMFVADGKDAATVEQLAADLQAHGGAAANITEVCIDMSPAFIKGTKDHLPTASITFDKFHAVKIVNEAVDLVRRAEQKSRPELLKSRYVWLKNRANLTKTQNDTLTSLTELNLKTARAYQIRLGFQELYAQPTREAALAFFKRWYFWATHSKLRPVIDAARTIKRHQDGLLRWFDTKIANGLLEGINSLVQAAKAKARGYRSTDNLKAIIYLVAGKLELKLPT
jgi:transposase